MTGTPTFSHGKGRHMHLHQRCGTTGKVSEWEYPGVTPNQSNTAESGAVNGTTVLLVLSAAVVLLKESWMA
jgi:hypothetical protein